MTHHAARPYAGARGRGAITRTVRVPSRSTDPGPMFVLLHGIGLSHRSFTGLARHLSEVGDVIAFDLPGFGGTPHPRRRLSVEDHSAIVGEHLVRLGVGPVVVVGHSMGAQLAIDLARENPSAVTHVVLVGPVVDAGKRTLVAQAFGLLLDSPFEPPATQMMVAFDYFRCGIPWFLTESVAMRDYPTHLVITDVTQPVLVVRGEHDPIADAPWCEWLSAQAAHGSLATISGRRHNVVHSDPAATAAAVIAFVAASDPAPARSTL